MRLTLLFVLALCTCGRAQHTDTLLLQLDTNLLTAVTVWARKIPHGELASQRISQLDIYLNPAAKADPLLAVNSLPAGTNPDETANVSLRGSPATATGIYLNDVPIRSAVRLDQSNGVGQFSIFGQVPLREVRIFASHPPVSFSQTSAGAVALYTSPELPALTVSGLSLNLAGASFSHQRPLGKKGGVRAFVNYGNLSAFRAANQGGLPELKRSRAVDAAVQLVHRFGPKKSVQLFYLGFAENYRFATATPYFSGDFVQRKPRHLAVVNWRFRGERWAWTLNQSLDWEHAEFRFGNVLTSPRRLSGHAAGHGRYQRAGFTLQTGLALNLYDDRTEGSYPLSDYALRPEDPSGNYVAEAAHQLAEAYVYGQWRLGQRWLLGAGLKPVFHLPEQRLYPTLQASLRFTPHPRHKLNFGGGTFAQLLAPGPDLPSWQWLRLRQLALEYTYRHRAWTVEAALYAKRESYARTPDLRVRGGELRLQVKDNGWTTWASGALIHNHTVATEVPTRRDLPFLARAQVQKQLDGQWTLGLAATSRRGTYFRPVIDRTPLPGREDWFAPVYAPPAAGTRYPDYHRLDLSASKVFLVGEATQLIVYANLGNALNRKNVRAYTYDATFRQRSAEVYARRIVFFGAVLNW